MSTRARITATIASTVAVLGVLAPTAATASPTADYLSCDSGGSKFQCVAYATGVRPLQSVQWTINGNYRPQLNGITHTSVFSCSPGSTQFVITIVDANGVTQVIDDYDYCRTGPWT
ncbi:hypothetical protein [Actinokineospora diospyrosa]|uniref:Ig-like domain-containing protein n=1 Tax=Actinokineospora diospyrosa TaxID=103728 RepID=A0ABT1I4W3_9PSEU|nr:hypothetical protein [Actinokineospora diospyrosa]MCP2267647.1 hypothetical protein [Actinokineospora diospyrosa]